MNMTQINEVFQLLSYIVVILGVPVGLHKYFHAVKKEQMDREYGTYNALDEKYTEFLEFCYTQPHLDIFDIPDTVKADLTDEQKKQELIGFSLLCSIFERAYLMYRDPATAVKKRQWSGWHAYILDYCKRDNFRKAWDITGIQFDTDFQNYMAENLRMSKG